MVSPDTAWKRSKSSAYPAADALQLLRVLPGYAARSTRRTASARPLIYCASDGGHDQTDPLCDLCVASTHARLSHCEGPTRALHNIPNAPAYTPLDCMITNRARCPSPVMFQRARTKMSPITLCTERAMTAIRRSRHARWWRLEATLSVRSSATARRGYRIFCPKQAQGSRTSGTVQVFADRRNDTAYLRLQLYTTSTVRRALTRWIHLPRSSDERSASSTSRTLWAYRTR